MRLKDFFSSIHDLLHQLFRLWALTSQSVEKQHKNSLSLANSTAVEKRMSLFASPSPQPPSAGPTLGKSNWKWGPKYRTTGSPRRRCNDRGVEGRRVESMGPTGRDQADGFLFSLESAEAMHSSGQTPPWPAPPFPRALCYQLLTLCEASGEWNNFSRGTVSDLG